MKYILQNLIHTAFFLALAIMTASSLYVYQQIQRLIETNTSIVHTYQVIDKLNSLLVFLVLSEKQQVMYLESSDTKYLKSLAKALENIKINYAVLKSIIQNPAQQIKVANLDPLVKNHLNSSAEVLRLYKTKGRQVAIQSSFIGTSTNASDELKHQIYNIKNIEFSLLEERDNKSIQGAKKSNLIIINIACLTIALLIFSFLLLNLQNKRQLRAEHKRKDAENQLKGIIEGTSDLIAALNLNRQFITFNKAYKHKIKKSFGRDILVGMNIKDVFNENSEDSKKIIALWERALQGEEFTATTRFSDHTFFEITFSLIKNSMGELMGVSHIMRNTTQRAQEELIMKLANEKLESGVQDLEKRYQEISLLNEMTESLQSCLSAEEAYSPIKSFCQQVLPFSNGMLYLMHPSHTYLELGISWGNPTVKEFTFVPDDCWALRRNQMHIVKNPELSVICEHANSPQGKTHAYACIPLMAHNETLGLLYLELSSTESIPTHNLLNEHQQLLLVTTAEHISLALANIKLRETLRFLSVRDPLTGLYNRRYLEETLSREFMRAERNKVNIAIIMIDIDHFKRFNDTHGHEAGDCVLKNVAKLFQDMTRGSDVVCRFGGEEFLILLYDTSYHSAKQYAENLRKSIAQMIVQYNGKTVGLISISAGISLFPDDGAKPQGLIESADQALYKAKKLGRNRVVTVSEESFIVSSN